MKAVNLIPTDQRRAQASGAQGGSSYVVLGVLAVLLLMAVAYVFTSNNVNSRKSDAAAAKTEADQLEAQVAARGAYTNFSQVKEQRIASVRTVADTRFDWERLMRELSRVMPSGSWIQATDASVTGNVTGSDAPTTTTTGAPVAPQPKANLVGCTPDQSDVAAMMVRMRQLHRVSDVELNESVKQVGTSGDASVDNCGQYYKFDITVTFDAAEPSTEAPRGESQVPASLGGGS
ncbi:MAG: PilN domain-containing protein [Thermoleophilaceae bacterium]|jgi:Tfp pilus assembly protein PilN